MIKIKKIDLAEIDRKEMLKNIDKERSDILKEINTLSDEMIKLFKRLKVLRKQEKELK